MADRASLEAELGIPPNAVLPSVPPSLEGGSNMSGPLFVSSDCSSRCCIIGRNIVCDVRFDHKSISRKHAAVYERIGTTGGTTGGITGGNTGALVLRDLGGKKGVFVNGERVEGNGEMTLKDGDVIKFGNMEEEFKLSYTPAKPVEKVNEDEKEDEKEEEVSSKPAKPSRPDSTNMTARQIRELEIKEMMESFDVEQTYTKYERPKEEIVAEEKEEETKANAEDANDGYRRLNIPISHSVSISSSSKTISSITLDPSNTRMICGSLDYGLRCYNFSGMDSSHRPFRDVIPDDGNPLVALDSRSIGGEKILVCTSSASPRILDRNAAELQTFVKGDVYITDVTNTKGHTAAVTGGMWHPKEKDKCMTCGMDGSVRLWKTDGKQKTLFGKLICDQVFRVRNKRGVRAPCTAASFDNTGSIIFFGTQCGSIQSFSTSAFHINTPLNSHHTAHTSTITCIRFSPDNKYLATRSTDSTVNIYDAEAFSKPGKNTTPIKTLKSVETSYEFCNVCFSPDSSLLIVGTCVNPKKAESSFLHFFPTAGTSTSPIASIASTPSISTPVVEWAPKINQIITGSSDGKVQVMYDPTLSQKGVLQSASRKPRKVNALDALLLSRGDQVGGEIFTPHALPLFQTKKEDRRSKEKKSKDRMPEQASGGIMMGGKSAASTLTNTQAIVDNLGISRTDVRLLSRDPREDLFKYNDKNPTGVKTGMDAYDTKPVLAETTAEEEQARRKRQKTG